ncbi:hypothetical protein AK812_SmicGene35474 [Symbiodinium microadriaticum]|uniref:Uncharacterized protein n=1 Tax=Symbiodinium microadriaticum TaxID=2951 RepID=A0A1Q9CLB5_SYMMI|nr:hypothetical protein AK812_SmicGene35474 [Symbiodinium microadriaticum]
MWGLGLQQQLRAEHGSEHLRELRKMATTQTTNVDPYRWILPLCELYFAAVAVVCTFSVFQRGDQPARPFNFNPPAADKEEPSAAKREKYFNLPEPTFP